ncbi:MAG: hypothetical protein WC314_25945 [Vulcanimicrobiota bacterium]
MSEAYRKSWEDLKSVPKELSPPNLGGASQQLTVLDRFPQWVNSGFFMALAICGVAAWWSMVVPVAVGFPVANLGIALLTSFLLSLFLVMGALQALNGVGAERLPSRWGNCVSLGICFLAGTLAILFQSTVVWGLGFWLSGPSAKIDQNLLLVEAISSAFLTLFRTESFWTTAMAGFVAQWVSQVWLARSAPWYVPRNLPTLKRALLGTVLMLSLLGVFWLPYQIRSGATLTEGMAQELNETVADFDEVRAVRRQVWRVGGTAGELRKLAEKGTLSEPEAAEITLRLARTEPSSSFAANFVTAWWLDEKLGFNHRRHSHHLELEAEVVPVVLDYWIRLREEKGAETLWNIRHTGTLFAMEYLLDQPETDRETLLLLQERLEQLRLTGEEARRAVLFKMTEKLGISTRAPLPHPLPDTELDWRSARIAMEKFPAETLDSAADTLEAWGPELEQLYGKKVDRKAFTIEQAHLFSPDDLQSLTALPTRLESARQAVAQRLQESK